MYRRLGYTGAWVTATSVSLSVAMLCAGVVLHPAPERAPRLLSATKDPTVRGERAVLTGPMAIGVPAGAPVASGAARPKDPRADRADRPQPSTPAGATPGGTVATTPSQRRSTADLVTYRTRGGAATLRLSATQLAVVAVAPQPGYTWRTQKLPAGRIAVTFATTDRASALYALPATPPTAALGAPTAPAATAPAAPTGAGLQPTISVVEYSW
jgi:hypothetical protein